MGETCYHIMTVAQMKDLGAYLAQKHHKIALSGVLGAGKTTLTQGFVMGKCGSWDAVSSPTYVYSQVYADSVLHIDMYRLQTRGQCLVYGIADQIASYPYIVIERPQFDSYYMDDQRSYISIDIQEDTSRMVKVCPFGDGSAGTCLITPTPTS